MEQRFSAVGMIRNEKGEYLICEMPEDRGVFPGQWAIPGGKIEKNETMVEGLKREVREEVGLELEEVEPWYFRDDVRVKIKPGEKPREVYMVYLMFKCMGKGEVKLNEAFEEFAWVGVEKALEYDLNEATVKTFGKLKLELGV